MDKATEPAKPTRQGKHARRGKVHPRVNVEDRIVPATVPAGSRFKDYETYTVQELVLTVHAVRYQRERWVTPNGKTIIAPLPEGTRGHYGPDLRRFVLMQYHQGQTTLPPSGDAVAVGRRGDLQARDPAVVDRRPGRLPGRKPRRVASRPADFALGIGR